MAREALRPDADLAHETGRAGLVEDRYTRDERAAEEDGEKGLAEYSAALQAVAPILADRGAALTALPTVRRLIRFHDDEPRSRNLVPPWLADQKERSEEHTSELQSPCNLVCRLLLEKIHTLPFAATLLPSSLVFGCYFLPPMWSGGASARPH